MSNNDDSDWGEASYGSDYSDDEAKKIAQTKKFTSAPLKSSLQPERSNNSLKIFNIKISC